MKYISKKYNNIYWFLIDGLRPDFLHIKEAKSKRILLTGCSKREVCLTT